MKLLAFRICGVLFVAISPLVASAQFAVPWTGGGGANNNWTNEFNWDTPGGGLPTGAFDQTAAISTGATALINSDLSSLSLPDGPPGGLAVSNGSTVQIVSGGAFVMDTSGPHTPGAASFTSGGTLSMNGASTSFTSNSLSFAGGGIYNPVITSASQGLISVPGTVEFGGGILRPTFGFSASPPQSWTLIDAAAINGSFTLDSSSSGLPLGQKLSTSIVAGGANGQQLRLSVNNVLALTVNADTGAASINSPTGTSIIITGYGVASGAGQLSKNGWSTLTSQLGGGWSVAGTPSSSHLDEIAGPVTPGSTTQASLTVNSTPRSLGSPFAEPQPFGIAPNLSFQYVTKSGQLVDGAVQVTGLNAVNNLLLTVDPSTGQAQLKNSSKTTIKLAGYSILSDSGALKPANGSWSSLQDQAVTGVDEANATANHLSELIPLVANTLTLTAGQSYSLGSLFNTSGQRDLRLEFDFAGLTGDFNKNGTVDAADYTTWRDGLGTKFTMADFTVWKNNFGASNPLGGGPLPLTGVVTYGTIGPGAGGGGAVPEPPTVVLAMMFLGIAILARKELR